MYLQYFLIVKLPTFFFLNKTNFYITVYNVLQNHCTSILSPLIDFKFKIVLIINLNLKINTYYIILYIIIRLSVRMRVFILTYMCIQLSLYTDKTLFIEPLGVLDNDNVAAISPVQFIYI